MTQSEQGERAWRIGYRTENKRHKFLGGLKAGATKSLEEADLVEEIDTSRNVFTTH